MPTRSSSSLLLPLAGWGVLAMGCGTKTTPVTDSAAPTPEPPSALCSAEIESSVPDDGAEGVYYRTGVEIELSEPAPSATLEVREAGGAVVPGASTVDGVYVRWAGDPLAPDTTYFAVVSDDCGSVQIMFETSVTGDAAVDVTGRVYDLDLGTGRWLAPEGFEDVLPTIIGGYGMLLSPLSVSGSEISMLAAVTENGVQNTCAPTIPLTGADYQNPYFELTTPAFPVTLPAETFTITDFVASGAFAPDGSAIEGVEVGGLLDTRPLANVILGTGDACPALGALGVDCEACPDGSGDFCVEVRVVDVRAEEVLGVIVEILKVDASCGA